MTPDSQQGPGLAELGAASEQSLITQAVATNPPQDAAFAELWRRHRAYIGTFCARRLGGKTVAEDVTQNVALKAYAAIHRFEQRCRFSNLVDRHRDHAVRRASTPRGAAKRYCTKAVCHAL